MYAGLMISASAISDFREKAIIPPFLKIMLFFFSIFFLSFEKKQPFARSAPGSLPSLFKFSKTNLLGSVKQMFWFILIDFPNVSVHYFILFFPFWLPSPLSHPMPVFSANEIQTFLLKKTMNAGIVLLRRTIVSGLYSPQKRSPKITWPNSK